MMTVETWIKTFISHLLHITHSQWIYRNISLHHHRFGAIEHKERHELLREIDILLETDPDEVAEESKFLLEIDFQQLQDSPTTEQSYWVHAMKAAVRAGRRSRPPRRCLNPNAPSFRPRLSTTVSRTAAPSKSPSPTTPLRHLPYNIEPITLSPQQRLPPPRLNQPPRGSAAEILLTYRINENSVALIEDME
jgi:hypothetical protein